MRGTVWLTQDRCDRTLTKVTQGTVSVRDNVKRKTVLVRARPELHGACASAGRSRPGGQADLTAPVQLQDHRGGLRTRGGTRVLLAAALAALVALAVPSAAHAQGALLDGAPLNVFADGLGAIQVRQDGVDAGLFYDPTENPAHAGLEIKEGETYYPLRTASRPRSAASPAGSRPPTRATARARCSRSTRSARTCA